jgi:hypothetical protein
LQEKATSASFPQEAQRTRAKPWARIPQVKYRRSSLSMNRGRPGRGPDSPLRRHQPPHLNVGRDKIQVVIFKAVDLKPLPYKGLHYLHPGQILLHGHIEVRQLLLDHGK